MNKRILKYLSLGVLFSILSLGNLENLCRIYPTLGFDNQALLFWNYTAANGLLPFRDIYYPYGLLSYYKGQNIIAAFIYLLISPVLFLGIFFTLQRVFRDKLFAIASFVFFFLFIIIITGFETFTRYGSITALSILYAYIFYSNKNKSRKILLALGVLGGIILALINDIGIYTLVIFVVFSVCNKLLISKFKLQINQSSSVLKELIIFIFGYSLGLIPFFIYLISTQSLSDFSLHLLSLSELALFAKTPFFHSIFTVDNLFTLAMLMTAIVFLCYKFFYGDKKASFVTYLQISLVLVLILLEQKSIIRSIDSQLTFIGLLLFFTFIYELRLSWRKYGLSKLFVFVYFINISMILLFVIGLRVSDEFVNQYPIPSRISSAIKVFRSKSCVDDNLKVLISKNRALPEIKNELYNTKNFSGKVFTFPGEPIFYIMLKQKPPYYPTIYEATPINAQEKLITYIQKENIDVILYNFKTRSIQDEVPDTIRGRLLYEYIRSNYYIEKKVNDYLIFYRKN
ncbi:MAG: hypothetical protein AAB531_00725 [Patescibacteria group bacterium]